MIFFIIILWLITSCFGLLIIAGLSTYIGKKYKNKLAYGLAGVSYFASVVCFVVGMIYSKHIGKAIFYPVFETIPK